MDVYIDNVLDKIKGSVVNVPNALMLTGDKEFHYKQEEQRVFIMEADGVTPKTEDIEGISVPLITKRIKYTPPGKKDIQDYCARYGWKYISHSNDDENHTVIVAVNFVRHVYGNRKVVLFESKEDAFDALVTVGTKNYFENEEGFQINYLGIVTEDGLPFYSVIQTSCED